MKTVFLRKGSLAATVFQRLAFIASVGFLALSSQFLHAAPTGAANGAYSGGADRFIDKNLEAEAQLTDISIRFNLNPYGYRYKNSRRIRKGFSNVPRRSFGNRYPYGKRYSKRFSNFNSYDRYGRPIYRDYRRKSGSYGGHSFRRH